MPVPLIINTCTSGSDGKTIIVTGATGLVGNAIKRVLAKVPDENFGHQPDSNEKWVYLSSRDADLRRFDETKAIFEKYKPTHVLHLAAGVGGLFKNMSFKADMFRDNILINDNIIHCCHIFQVKKLLSCLSTCIFPDQTSYPIDENMIHDGPPHCSNFGYAYAKRMIDVQSRAYREQYGDMFTSVIPTNIFGPHDNFNLDDSHVIPGLLHKCLVAKRENQASFIVAGSGEPLRQFIFSEDLAKLMIWALRKYDDPEPLILSVDESDEVSISAVAGYVGDALDYKGSIQYDLSKPDGQYKKTASNKKLRMLLPDFNFTPLEEAIKITADWLVENYQKARK